MHQADIVTMYDYNYWATRRIVGAAAQLTTAQFTAPTPLSWGSVRDVLTHVLGAEWIWRLRCQEGLAPTKLLDPAEFPNLDALLARWAAEETAMRAYVAGLTDAALNSPVTYRNTAGQPFESVLWQILLHVVNHGTQHRAEVAHVLTSLAHSPGDIDFIVYLREVQ
jgi:uncharacterized damage-inducible protein DinB